MEVRGTLQSCPQDTHHNAATGAPKVCSFVFGISSKTPLQLYTIVRFESTVEQFSVEMLET